MMILGTFLDEVTLEDLGDQHPLPYVCCSTCYVTLLQIASASQQLLKEKDPKEAGVPSPAVGSGSFLGCPLLRAQLFRRILGFRIVGSSQVWGDLVQSSCSGSGGAGRMRVMILQFRNTEVSKKTQGP